MSYLPEPQSRMLVGQSLIGTALTVAHSLRARGPGRTLLFAALGIGLPVLGEYIGINRLKLVRHRVQPQFQGIPPSVALGWYNIGYATFALVESVLPADLPAQRRRLLLPAAIALTATSLDLLLDCFGLAEGYWEWNADGLYAAEIAGPNGRRGIPISNYASWLGLTATVTLLYLLLSDDQAADASRPGAAGSVQAGRTAALLFLIYYGRALAWAIRERKFRYIVYSFLAPLVVVLALRGRRNA